MVAGENWVAANKVGCDALLDPRLSSPVMQAPSYTGSASGNTSELGTPLSSNGNGTPTNAPQAALNKTDTTNRWDFVQVPLM